MQGMGLLVTVLLINDPAYAQRAVSPVSSDVAAGASDTTPPPEGMPGTFGPDIVYGGDVTTHLQGEITKPSGTNTHATAFDDTNLDLYSNYSDWLSLNSNIKLERNRNDNNDDYFNDRNSFLRSEGLTLRQLYATVRPIKDVIAYGGKIHTAFGSAYAEEPGNFYNFASDYEQDERIGFGVQYRLPEATGLKNARLSVETFYLDTSLLSTSLISQPALDDPTADRLRHYQRGQFGPSNTGDLSSVAVSLRGGEPERGFTYQASLTQEGTDDPMGRTEFGESFGGTYDPSGDGIPLGSRLGLTPFLEYTHFSNFSGIAGLGRHYVVGGVTFTNTRWQYILAGGLRQSTGISTDTDLQQSLSVNYQVTPELTLGGGINHSHVANIGSWTVGPSLTYEIGF
jgi:hypothetical protein